MDRNGACHEFPEKGGFHPPAILASTVMVLMILALAALGPDTEQTAQAAPAPVATATPGEPTDVPVPTPTIPAWTGTVPLTTTTISLFSGDKCAVWGERVGASSTVTATAGPVLLSYSLFSRYTQAPRYELKYLFSIRVGDTLAGLTVNGQRLTTIYRGQLRIEYMPLPVSVRYSYATYGLAQLRPGIYEVAGEWRLASGDLDGPRKCRLVVFQ